MWSGEGRWVGNLLWLNPWWWSSVGGCEWKCRSVMYYSACPMCNTHTKHREPAAERLVLRTGRLCGCLTSAAVIHIQCHLILSHSVVCCCHTVSIPTVIQCYLLLSHSYSVVYYCYTVLSTAAYSVASCCHTIPSPTVTEGHLIL